MMKRFMLAALVLAAGSMTLFAADKPAKPQAAQDVQVAVEMKTVCVSESFFERMGVDFMMKAAPKVIRAKGCDGVERIGIDFCKPCDAACPKDGKCDPTKVMFLNDCQLHMLMEAVQGDRHANVMSAPKITTMNGQTACICVGDQQAYVTGVKVETVNGQVVMVPENKTFETGIKLDLLPTVSADRKFVSLQLKGRFTEMNGEAKLHPVTAMVNPVFEGGLTGVPVPFTQFIQQPSFQTVAVDTKACVPDGGTMLIDAGTITRTEPTESGPPVLSKIPYLNRLVKKVGYHKETCHILVLATPRVIVTPPEAADKKCCEDCPLCKSGKPCGDCCKNGKSSEEEATVPPPKIIYEPMPKSPRELRIEKMAAKLVDKYHKAIADGELEKARKLARQALDLDPACFSATETRTTPKTGVFGHLPAGTFTRDLDIPIQASSFATPLKMEPCAPFPGGGLDYTKPSTVVPLPVHSVRPESGGFSYLGSVPFQMERGVQNGAAIGPVTGAPVGATIGTPPRMEPAQLDTAYIRQVIRRAVPMSDVEVIAAVNGKVILTGWVSRAEDMDIAVRVAASLTSTAGAATSNIINAIRVGRIPQVERDVTAPRPFAPAYVVPEPVPAPTPIQPDGKRSHSWFRRNLFGQAWIGGMTLPSEYYLVPKPDYFPPDPDFPLSKELELMQAQDAKINGEKDPNVRTKKPTNQSEEIGNSRGEWWWFWKQPFHRDRPESCRIVS